MKQISSLLTLFFLITGSLIAQYVPSPREIGDAYIENTGGKDAWLAIRSMRLSGFSTMQGMQFPIVMVSTADNKQYMEVDAMGQKIIQAYDGQTAWQIMPFAGITTPTPMSREEAEQMANTKFFSEFINTEARGFTLTAVAGKVIEGAPTYGVRVTDRNGYDMTYYFDQEFFVPIMTTTPIKSGPERGGMIETYLSDYAGVENVFMPMHMEVRMSGQIVQNINITRAELNPMISNNLFSMPRK